MIQNERDCTEYIAAYAGQHFHKLNAAFASWEFQRTENRSVEIIDWGCGLATATCVLIDYLIEKNISPNIKSITLVEQSMVALEKGREIIHQMFQTNELEDCEIKFINKQIDDITTDDFESEANNIKVHLFSNIIDMDSFNLSNLYALIVKSFQGLNRLICVSPDNGTHIRLDDFRNLFSQTSELINEVNLEEAVYGEIFRIDRQSYLSCRIGRYERQFTVDLPRK